MLKHLKFISLGLFVISTNCYERFAQCEYLADGSDFPSGYSIPEFDGGDGSFTNPFLICFAQQLSNIQNYPNQSFLLLRNLSWADGEITPIGNSTYPFSGSFEGAGFSISNLKINTGLPSMHSGLFGVVSGSIRNLSLNNLNAQGDTNLGGLVGQLKQLGKIENCHVEGLVSGYSVVGGLVGQILVGASVQNSSFDGDLTNFGNSTGGIAGENNGTIQNAKVLGTIQAMDQVGGVAGHNKSTILNTYSFSSLNAQDETGGLVGLNTGTITNSYVSSTISASGVNVGGLVGRHPGTGSINFSFWNSDFYSPNNFLGLPKTTPELQFPTTFFNVGWNTTNWVITNGFYPRLIWEN